LEISDGGDVSFYEDTGTTAKFFWDAAAEALAIGSSSPVFGLSVESDNGSGYAALFRKSSSDPALTIQTTSSITQIQGLNSALNATNDIAMQLSGGNVGIGTSSPATKLELSADNGVSGVANVLRFNDSDTGVTAAQPTGRIEFAENDGGNTTVSAFLEVETVGTSGGGEMTFGTGAAGATATERMRIDSSGHLLVGTTDESVHIGTTSGAVLRSEGFGFFAVSGNSPIYANRLTNDGAIIDLRKDGSQVGSIGTTAGELTVGSANTALRFTDAADRIDPWSVTSNTAKDNAIDFGTGARRFKDLYLSGDVYVNNTNKSTIPSGALSFIINTSDTSYPNVLSGGYGGSHDHQKFFHAGTHVGTIRTTASATSYITSSDYRLKENVVPLIGATERIKQLNPSRFNFIVDADTTVDGFLAHEVADVVPEAITGTKDGMRDEEYEVTPAVLDDDGNVVTEAVMGTHSVPDYQGIDQSKLVPLLVATIQELEARIAALESN
jgi:hypothetical protein